MQEIASYIKGLITSITGSTSNSNTGTSNTHNSANTSTTTATTSAAHKRNRDDSNDNPPNMKKYRTVNSQFPKIMPTAAEEERKWITPNRVENSSRTRYIPIQKENEASSSSASISQHKTVTASKFSTNSFYSRPSEGRSGNRYESTTLRNSNILQTSQRSPRSIFLLDNSRLAMQESSNAGKSGSKEIYFKRVPVINIDDEDEDDHEEDDDSESFVISDEEPSATYKIIDTRTKSSKPVEFIDLSNIDDCDSILIKNVKPRRSETIQRISRNNTISSIFQTPQASENHTYKFFKSKNRDFKTPNFSKTFRIAKNKPMFKQRQPMSAAKRESIAQCFNLEEKKKYNKLINMYGSNFTPRDITRKSDRLDLSVITKAFEQMNNNKSFTEDLKNNGTDEKHEYDPITVASINLSDSEPEAVTSADDASTTSSIRVAPVNSLKELMQDKPLASRDWIDQLLNKYKDKHLKTKLEIEDYTLQNQIITDLNIDQHRSKIERTAKSSLTIPIDKIEILIEDEGFPELTDEQERKIDIALQRNANPNQVLIEKFNLSIARRDLLTLSGLNWLNDEVINFYMNLLMERSQQKSDLPKVYGMNTFFYPKLMQAGHSGLKRWTRKVDIFSYDLITVPVHLGVHWCMSIVDFRNKTIRYFDSMGGNNMECCNALLKYLEDECMDKKREKFDTSSWKKEVVKDIPQQMNGSDCGVFSCTFAEFISRNASITFSQNDMPYIRRKMVLEIVQGQLIIM